MRAPGPKSWPYSPSTVASSGRLMPSVGPVRPGGVEALIVGAYPSPSLSLLLRRFTRRDDTPPAGSPVLRRQAVDVLADVGVRDEVAGMIEEHGHGVLPVDPGAGRVVAELEVVVAGLDRVVLFLAEVLGIAAAHGVLAAGADRDRGAVLGDRAAAHAVGGVRHAVVPDGRPAGEHVAVDRALLPLVHQVGAAGHLAVRVHHDVGVGAEGLAV